jgi:hypothetical protein
MANLDAATKTQLQGLQNQNQILLNTNTQASSMFTSAIGALNNIANSTTMDSDTKQAQSAQVYANLQQSLKVISATSGLNLSDIINENPYIPGGQAAGDQTPLVAQNARIAAAIAPIQAQIDNLNATHPKNWDRAIGRLQDQIAAIRANPPKA